jgi:tetratricopeptide (TPR) repeat protein
VTDFREAIDQAGVVHDRLPQGSALIGLATVQLRRGEAAEALATVESAVKLATDAKLPVLEGNALNVLAGVRVRLGQPGFALSAAESALVLHQRTGHRPGEARSHLVLGAAHRALGHQPEAFAHLRANLLLSREMGISPFSY